MVKTLNIKHLLFVLFFISGFFTLSGQIQRLEYFTNNDPGVGKALQVSITSGTEVSGSVSIGLDTLPIGFNILGVRAIANQQNATTTVQYDLNKTDGSDSIVTYTFPTLQKFGITRVQPFYVVKNTASPELLTGFEYFIDNDPGVGSANAITVTPSVEISSAFVPDVSGLSTGFHVLGTRAVSDKNVWSTTRLQHFYFIETTSTQDIVEIEYFINTDDGIGKCTKVPVTQGKNVNASFSPDIAGLQTGFHTLGIRAKTADGLWGETRTQLFYFIEKTLSSDISEIEYFINTDAGIGLCNKVAVTPGKNVSTVITPDLSGLNNGFHVIGVRAKTVDGLWGQTRIQYFYSVETSSSQSISELEYYINTDPGIGLASSITVAAGTNVEASFSPDISGLLQGFHTIGIRAKTQDGLWGTTRFRTFYMISPETVSENIVRAEYYIDSDPGFGNGIEIINPVIGDLDISIPIDVTVFSAGSHTLFIRVQDDKGKWSITHVEPFCNGVITDFSLPDSVCVGETFAITDLTIGANAQTEYAWDFENDGIVDNNTIGDISYSYADTGLYSIKLVAGDASTCYGSVIHTIEVLPFVTPTATLSTNNISTCSGDEVTIAVISEYEGNNPVYNWYLNGIATGDSNDTLLSSIFTDGDKIDCQILSDYMCTTTSLALSDTITLNVNPVLTPEVSISILSAELCDGESASFTASVNNAGLNPQVEWTVNGVPMQVGGLSFDYAGATNLDKVACNVTVTDPGCFSSTTIQSNEIELLVYPIVTPTIAIEASKTKVCSLETVSFTTNVTDEGLLPSFVWKVNGSEIGETGNSTILSSVQDGDIVHCELTSSVKCPSQQIVNSNNITIEVASPIVIESFIVNDVFPCSGDANGSIDYTISGGEGIVQVSLNGNSVFVSPIENLIPGNYELLTVDEFGCSNSAIGIISEPAPLVINSVSTNDLTCFEDATGVIGIDAQGEGVLEYAIVGIYETTSEFSNLPAGDYNIFVSDANGCNVEFTGNPVSITQPDQIAFNALIAIDVTTCIAPANGTITVEAVNGQAPMQYSLDNNSWQSDGLFENLSAGTYKIFATDGICTVESASVIINNAEMPVFTVGAITSVCAGEDITLSIESGNAEGYTWSAEGYNTQTGTSVVYTTSEDAIFTVTGSTGDCSTSQTVELKLNKTYDIVIDEIAKEGDTITFNGVEYTQPGSVVINETTVGGCDSIVHFSVTFIEADSIFLFESICQGDIYSFEGTDYTEPGIYEYKIEGSLGQDSVRILELMVNPVFDIAISETIIQGNTFLYHGTEYSEGLYDITLTSELGCDSIIHLTITEVVDKSLLAQSIATANNIIDTITNVNPPSALLSFQATLDSAIMVYDNADATQFMVDSTYERLENVIISFIESQIVKIIVETNISESICDGDVFDFNGKLLTESGEYSDTISLGYRKDSIVHLSLLVYPSYAITLYETIFEGETFLFGGTEISNSGKYTQELTTVGTACDSIITLNLTVIPQGIIHSEIEETICNGDIYSFGSTDITEEGVYQHTYTAVGGGDSLVTLTLLVNPIYDIDVYETITEGESLSFNGTDYSVSGDYVAELQSVAGCDSIVTLHLTVNPVNTYDVSFIISDGTDFIEGVEVTLGQETLITNANGQVTFSNVEEGTGINYSVSVTGYVDQNGTIDVPQTEPFSIILIPVQTTVTVEFVILDENNATISDAILNINDSEYISDANGLVSLELDKDVEVNYTASKSGYYSTQASYIPIIDQTNRVGIVLEKIPEKTFTFIVSVGTIPIEGASISIEGEILTTDEDGKISYKTVVLDDIPFSVSANGYYDTTGSITTASKLFVTVRLRPDGTLPNSIPEQEDEILVYPNPVDEVLYVNGVNTEILSIALISESGIELKCNFSQNDNHIDVQIPDISKGLYLLKIIADKNCYVESILVK